MLKVRKKKMIVGIVTVALVQLTVNVVIVLEISYRYKGKKMKNKLKWIAVIGVAFVAYILGSVNSPKFTEPMTVILYDRTNKAIMQYEAYPEIENGVLRLLDLIYYIRNMIVNGIT